MKYGTGKICNGTSWALKQLAQEIGYAFFSFYKQKTNGLKFGNSIGQDFSCCNLK